MNFLSFMVPYLFFFLLFFYISIPVHELGHLVFGLATGYRFVYFRLFSWVWVRKGDKIVCQKANGKHLVGQCLMEPPSWNNGFPFVLYNMGGGLFNLIMGLVLWLLYWLAGYPLSSFWLGAILGCMIQGLINLIPISASIPNDGMNIVTALRNKRAAWGLYLMFKLNAESNMGKRYGEFDDSLFATLPDDPLDNYFVAYIVMCRASRLADLSRWDGCIDCYQTLPLDKLPSYYRNAILTDYIYYYTAIRPDFSKAENYYTTKGMSAFLQLGVTACTRTLAAYEYFAKGDREKGRQLLEKAKQLAANEPNKGNQISEEDFLTVLESNMNQAADTPAI